MYVFIFQVFLYKVSRYGSGRKQGIISGNKHRTYLLAHCFHHICLFGKTFTAWEVIKSTQSGASCSPYLNLFTVCRERCVFQVQVMMSLSDTQEIEEHIRNLLLTQYNNGSITAEDVQISRIRESSSVKDYKDGNLNTRIIFLLMIDIKFWTR